MLLPHFDLHAELPELGGTVGDALLAVHRSYLPSVSPLLDGEGIHAISHITGGGIIGNTTRVLPEDLELSLEWDSWSRPPLFSLIQKVGEVPEEDMRRTFNLGIGLILIVDPAMEGELLSSLETEKPIRIGKVVKRS